MSERGLILFHDINVREGRFGVWKFWEEVKKQYPWREFSFSHGLGIIAAGKASECLAEFFELGDEEFERVHRVFGLLGQRIAAERDQSFVRHLQSQLQDRDKQLLAGQNEVASFQGQIGELQQQLAQKNAELQKLATELAALNAKQETLTKELEALRTNHEHTVQELQTKSSVLNQICGSHGWKALSVYYKLRDKLLPGGTLRRIVVKRVLHMAFSRRRSFSRNPNDVLPVNAVGNRLRREGISRRKAYKFSWTPRRLKEGIRLLRDMRLVAAAKIFDSDWYLHQNPDVANAGVNPLRHYLRRGAIEGRDPNPLFDSDWYLRQNPDVATTRINPLVHYLRWGAVEGRKPNPFFDSDQYLQQNPDLLKARANPLLDYLRRGTTKGRESDLALSRHLQTKLDVTSVNMKSAIPRQGAIVARVETGAGVLSWLNEALEAVKNGAQTQARPVLKPEPIVCPRFPSGSRHVNTDRRLICVTHVLPYPSRAGNEYRIHRMLTWLATQGFEIFPVICPLSGYSITNQRLIDACSVYPNLVLCQRDGTLLYQLAEGDAPIASLTGVKPRDFAKLLGEEDNIARTAARLLSVVRTFCPDPLIEVLLHLDSVLRPEVFLVDYVFMTRGLPLIRSEAIKVVDTIDVFSTKRKKVIHFGVEDSLALRPEEEASLLDPADLVIAIQSDEAEELHQLVPNKPVVTAGIDFDPIDEVRAPALDPVILLIASDNSLNVKGLKDFLRFAWPLIRREIPTAELRVAGSVGMQVDVDEPGVRILGQIDDVSPAYAEARLVINPAVAGTGLKIKTIEALCHLRPLVTWPSGVDGVEAEVTKLCHVATNWYAFARHVIDLCTTTGAAEGLLNKRHEIRERFSADTVYQELSAAMSAVQAVSK